MKRKCMIAAAIIWFISGSAELFYRNNSEIDNLRTGSHVQAAAQSILGDGLFSVWERQPVRAQFGNVRFDDLQAAERLTGNEEYLEADVDFDGIADRLVARADAAVPGAIVYSCYLNRDNLYVYCPSFEAIANPCIDEKNRMILSTNFNDSSFREWSRYRFADHQFVLTERLTAYAQFDSGQIIWRYNLESLTDGGLNDLELIKTVDTSDEMDLQFAKEWIYSEAQGWAIDSDQWKGFFFHEDLKRSRLKGSK